MKKNIVNILFAFLSLMFLSGCPVPLAMMEEAMYRKGLHDIEESQKAQADYAQREKDLLKKKQEYEQGGLLVSQLMLHVDLGRLYMQTAQLGKSLEVAENGLKIIDVLREKKLTNIDDDGYGRTSESEPYKSLRKLRKSGRLSTESDSLDNLRTQSYLSAKMQIYSLLSQNYKIVSDYAKEREFLQKSKQAGDELTKLSYEMIKEKMGEKDYEAYIKLGEERKSSYSEKSSNMSKLYVEIIKEHNKGNPQQVDKLIKKFADTFFPPDYIPETMAFTLGIGHPHADPTLQEKVKEYYKKYIGTSRHVYIQALLNNTIDRANEAASLVEKAINTFSKREMLDIGPAVFGFLSPTQYFRREITNNLPKPEEVPLAWRMLEARLLTEVGESRAITLWEGIIHDVEEFTPLAKKDKASIAFSKNEVFHLAFLGLSEIYEKLGSIHKATEYYERALHQNESSRASFSVETHKIVYLSKNRELYEKFINLNSQDAVKNLIAMERAKSRAMVDLMAERIQDTGDSVLKKVVAQRKIASMNLQNVPRSSGERAIQITPIDLTEEIEKLKQSRPELYSIISVETLTKDELSALVPEDTAVLSYYVADDYTLINLYQRDSVIVKKVNIPKSVLYTNVYNHRSRIKNPGHNVVEGQIGLDISWETDESKERLIIKNNMTFPLEILDLAISIKNIYGLIASEMSGYSPYSYQEDFRGGTTPKTNTINPGETREIYMIELESNEVKESRMTEYSQVVRIATNIGTFWISGIFERTPEDKLRIIEIGKSKTYWKLDKSNLYDLIIKPVEDNIYAKHLVIVPHGVLHFLPFESLTNNNGKYLIEKYVISYTPSLNVLKYSKQKNSGQKTRLVAYGDPLGDLTFAKSEVEQIKKLFAQGEIYTGEEVTIEKVFETIRNGDIVHFATHGVFYPSSPFDSALVLYGGKGSTAPLTVSRLLGLRMRPYLVTLSACDTGLARISGGDELLGLIRGFFVAGTPSLVTTLWPIDDKSTSLFMNRFYENLINNNMNKAQALRDAKLYLINEGYGNPYYWAAFILQGDWL